MNTNEQWFEPGDKVMRVAPSTTSVGVEKTPMGRVYCVASCFQDAHGGPWMTLVGIDSAPYDGFYTYPFRKVEEIRLCVDALKYSKTQEFQTH